MKTQFKFFASLLLSLLFFSCTSDKEEELSDVACVDTFTYTECVKTIIDTNCVVCHNSTATASGPFPLETFAQVKDKAMNGQLLNRIQLEAGALGIMPQTGKMPQAKVDVILAWANEGYKE